MRAINVEPNVHSDEIVQKSNDYDYFDIKCISMFIGNGPSNDIVFGANGEKKQTLNYH